MSHRASRFVGTALVVLLAAASGAALGVAQETPPPAVDARERGKALLAAAADAAGKSVLEKIESLEMTVRRKTFSAHGLYDSELQTSLVYPAQMRIEESVVQTWVKGGYAPSGSGPITPAQREENRIFAAAEGYDGTAGWYKSRKDKWGDIDLRTAGSLESYAAVTRDLPLDDAARIRIDLVGGIGLCRRAAQGKLEGTFVGEEDLLGHKVLAVQLAKVPGQVIVYLDPATHLLAGLRFLEASPDGQFDALEVWGDYKRVSFKSGGKEEAVQFPFLLTKYRNRQQYFEEKVKKLKLNTRPNPKIFAKPK